VDTSCQVPLSRGSATASRSAVSRLDHADQYRSLVQESPRHEREAFPDDVPRIAPGTLPYPEMQVPVRESEEARIGGTLGFDPPCSDGQASPKALHPNPNNPEMQVQGMGRAREPRALRQHSDASTDTHPALPFRLAPHLKCRPVLAVSDFGVRVGREIGLAFMSSRHASVPAPPSPLSGPRIFHPWFLGNQAHSAAQHEEEPAVGSDASPTFHQEGAPTLGAATAGQPHAIPETQVPGGVPERSDGMLRTSSLAFSRAMCNARSPQPCPEMQAQGAAHQPRGNPSIQEPNATRQQCSTETHVQPALPFSLAP
jgi:hypothetical protein